MEIIDPKYVAEAPRRLSTEFMISNMMSLGAWFRNTPLSMEDTPTGRRAVVNINIRLPHQ